MTKYSNCIYFQKKQTEARDGSVKASGTAPGLTSRERKYLRARRRHGRSLSGSYRLVIAKEGGGARAVFSETRFETRDSASRIARRSGPAESQPTSPLERSSYCFELLLLLPALHCDADGPQWVRNSQECM